MIKRLPRYAELKLQSLCAERGALCHRVDEDESGWDFLIEFAPKDVDGPADTRPAPRSAYVQVKSTIGPRAQCRIKLSNALRAAESDRPWFIVLVAAPEEGEPRLYAIHVWEKVIAKWLKAVRKAESVNRPLNRGSVVVKMSGVDDRSNDLVRWIEEALDAIGDDYSERKRAIFKSVGYEKGYGTATLSIQASSHNEILENFVGVGEGLKVKDFLYIESRFGIPVGNPSIQFAEGTLHISSKPTGECEIRLKNPRTAERIVILGHIYGTGIPQLPMQDQMFRFSAGFVDVLWRPCGEIKCKFGINDSSDNQLGDFEDLATIRSWLIEGVVDLQVWTRGSRICGGPISFEVDEPHVKWQDIAGAMRMLRTIAGTSADQGIRVRFTDISNASGLLTLYEIDNAPSLRLEFIPEDDVPGKADAILYWYQVEVGGWLFSALVERQVREDVMIDKVRRVTANAPRLVEAYAQEQASVEQRAMIEQDFERVSGDPTRMNCLCIGNIRELIGREGRLGLARE